MIVGQGIYCKDEMSYGIHISKRKKYKVLAIGAGTKEGKVRLEGNMKRRVWVPAHCFSEAKLPDIVLINIDDEITNPEYGCIEVTVAYSDGFKGYLNIMTVSRLKDILKNNKQYSEVEYFNPTHIIFVEYLNKATILKTIDDLDRKDELFPLLIQYD